MLPTKILECINIYQYLLQKKVTLLQYVQNYSREKLKFQN